MNTKKILTFTLIFLFSAPLVLLTGRKMAVEIVKYKDTNNNSETYKVDEHLMTVFIHGTILPIPSFSTFFKTIKGNPYLKKSQNKKYGFFQKYLINQRFVGIYQHQPISYLGLIEIDQVKNITPENTSRACKHITDLYKTVYQKYTPNPIKSHSVYTFGWDGKLSKTQRVRWANKLYKKLRSEIYRINQTVKPKTLKIELLAHSHGGNVALNLAQAEEKFKKNLYIDRLILLGTPVQSETKEFIHSSIFKKIYHIYSLGDYVQIIDMISTQDSYSKRRFDIDEKKSFTLPSNLTQIQTHIGDMNPLHNELWFLGEKGNSLYRKKLPINPFPVVVFAPAVINFIETNMQSKNDLYLQIDKDKNKLDLAFNDVTLTDTPEPSCKTSIEIDDLQNQIDLK